MQNYAKNSLIKPLIQNNYYFCTDIDFSLRLRSLFMGKNSYLKILQRITEMRLHI